LVKGGTRRSASPDPRRLKGAQANRKQKKGRGIVVRKVKKIEILLRKKRGVTQERQNGSDI